MADIKINDTEPQISYTAAAAQTAFTVPFEFFEDDHLEVKVDGTLQTLTTDYTVTGAGVTGGGTLTFTSAPGAGAVVSICRDTPVERLTDFQNNGDILASTLNTDLDRIVAMIQEREDQMRYALHFDRCDTSTEMQLAGTTAEKVIYFDTSGNPTLSDPGALFTIDNLPGALSGATPYEFSISEGQTVVNLGFEFIADGLIVSHNGAPIPPSVFTADTTAQTLTFDNALPEGEMIVYNIQVFTSSDVQDNADAAVAAAAAAATSESNAATSESNAATSETNAATSESNAATSASNASTSASNAATSETNAATSETNAAASASAAATSETNAAASETAAAASESAAATSETNAAASESAAATSETNAATSETNAATSETNAATSEANALDSENAAAQSADDAAAVVTGGDATLTPTAGKIPLADSDGKIDPDWLENIMTRAEWEAAAARERDARSGSGVIEYGKHASNSVNQGLWINGTDGVLRIGGATGSGRTTTALANVNGAKLDLYGVRNTGDDCLISFPDAPSDSSLLSRQDLVFLEVWHEKVTDKDVVYPYGNVQYGATTWEGVTLTQPEAASYSAYGAWESSPTAGYGLVWSTASADDRDTFIRDPQNNLYLDTDGELIQVRYRIRVVAGLGDSWTSTNGNQSQPRYSASSNYVEAQGLQTTTADTTATASQGFNTNLADADRGGMYNTESANSYTGEAFYVPIALVQRRNDGAFHPTFNPDGCDRFDDDGTPAEWWELSTITITSAADCFTNQNGDGDIASAVSGRPDGLYYDQISASDVQDLRNDANRVVDQKRYREKYFRDLVAGELRGFEGYRKVVETVTATPTAKADAGLQIRVDFAASTFTEFTSTDLYSGSVSAAFSKDGLANAIIIDAAGNPFKAVWLRDDTNDELYLHHVHGDTTSVIDITSDCTVLVLDKDDHSQETLLHCDIIGSPDQYPSDFTTTGVYGSPLCVAEDGSSLLPADVSSTDRKSWKLSRNITGDSDVQAVYHWDGATWAELSNGTADGNWDTDATNNELDLHEDTWGTTFTDTDVWLVFYETPANPLEIADNAEVLELGDVLATKFAGNASFANLAGFFAGKLGVGGSGQVYDQGRTAYNYSITPSSGLFNSSSVYFPQHQTLGLPASDTPAVKTLSYLSRENGKAYLQLIFKELIYNSGTTDYGDTGDFEVVDDLSTATDDNANTVLVGQKRVELPAFVLDRE